jgi:hypothetical protein
MRKKALRKRQKLAPDKQGGTRWQKQISRHSRSISKKIQLRLKKGDSIMKNETVKTGMKIGAAVGGLVFVVAGIVPGFYFGSYGTLILLQKLMGGTVEPTLVVRAAVVMGIVVGIACAAAVSIVVGGLLGTVMGYIVSTPAALREKRAATEKA